MQIAIGRQMFGKIASSPRGLKLAKCRLQLKINLLLLIAEIALLTDMAKQTFMSDVALIGPFV